MPFTATYGGACGDCDERVKPGDAATYNVADELVHLKCPSNPSEKPAETCMECFIQKPCPCEDGQ